MSYSEEISLTFDPETRIAELSAKTVLTIDSTEKLDTLCNTICSLLTRESGGKRCYLAVDISQIVIDPGLADQYAGKIKAMKEEMLFPEGLVRYGFEITRVTIKLAEMKEGKFPILFNKRDEALRYLEELSRNREAEAVG